MPPATISAPHSWRLKIYGNQSAATNCYALANVGARREGYLNRKSPASCYSGRDACKYPLPVRGRAPRSGPTTPSPVHHGNQARGTWWRRLNSGKFSAMGFPRKWKRRRGLDQVEERRNREKEDKNDRDSADSGGVEEPI